MEYGKIKKTLWIVLIIFLIITAIAYWTAKGNIFFIANKNDISGSNCSVNGNIATININGEIVTYILKTTDGSAPPDETSADDVVACINEIAKSDSVKGVIVRIDSGGGSPVASQEIATALQGLKKPTAAVIRDNGDSGAYLVASATDRVFASELSNLGSIGVTGSYLANYQQDANNGLTFEQLSAGKYKDSENPDKPLTANEKALAMRDINIQYQDFIQMVAANRHLPVAKVTQLADGSTVLGVQAKADGLIDEIGDINSATAWLESKNKLKNS